MNIKPIRTEQDYEAALAQIEKLFDARPGTPESDLLEVLTTLVEAYEEKHYPIGLPDPIAAIEYHMERLGLTRRDLEPFIGSRARVSEILNRRRPLTLAMIRRLHAGLGISTDILMQTYPLKGENYTNSMQKHEPTRSFYQNPTILVVYANNQFDMLEFSTSETTVLRDRSSKPYQASYPSTNAASVEGLERILQ